MASFTPHGQSTPFLCIDQCLDPPIVRIAWIQALRVGNVKWPVYRPLGLRGVLLLAGKPASSGERVKPSHDGKNAIFCCSFSYLELCSEDSLFFLPRAAKEQESLCLHIAAVHQPSRTKN